MTTHHLHGKRGIANITCVPNWRTENTHVQHSDDSFDTLGPRLDDRYSTDDILKFFRGSSLVNFHANLCETPSHDDVIKWKHFPRYWPFVRRIHQSPVNSPHKGQWRGALMFTLICVRINGWANSREAGDLRRYRTHYDVIVMVMVQFEHWFG